MADRPPTLGARGRFAAMAVVAMALGVGESAGSDTAAGPNIRIANEAHAARVRNAVRGASRRLAEPRCARVLSEFRDAEHHTLQANLDSVGQTAAGYLVLLDFHDGSDRRPCSASGVAAFTTPGSRSVWVCTQRFVVADYIYPELAEYLIIHEALHSLGLQENPPSSEQITRRVAARCAVRRP